MAATGPGRKRMKKMLMIVLAGLMTASVALAQAPEKGKALTYPQLADLLVKALGLNEYLPAGATSQQQFDLLKQNGIAPAGGWTLDEEAAVTKGDLARVLIEALEREDEVENPDDPQSWVDALAAMGISLSSAGEALGSVEALPDIVAQNMGFYSTDPLVSDIRTVEVSVHDPVPVQTAVEVVSKAQSHRHSKNPPKPTPY